MVEVCRKCRNAIRDKKMCRIIYGCNLGKITIINGMCVNFDKIEEWGGK